MPQDKENKGVKEVEQRALESVADQQDINRTLDKVETREIAQNHKNHFTQSSPEEGNTSRADHIPIAGVAQASNSSSGKGGWTETHHHELSVTVSVTAVTPHGFHVLFPTPGSRNRVLSYLVRVVHHTCAVLQMHQLQKLCCCWALLEVVYLPPLGVQGDGQ